MLTLTLSTEQKMYQMMKEAYGLKQSLAGKPECKLEYQIATRIHMNAFCFLLKKGMTPEMGEENGRLILGITMEGTFHACPVKSIKSVLKNDFAELEEKIPGLAEKAMQEEQADKAAQKSHKTAGGTVTQKRPNLLPERQQEGTRVNLDAVLQNQHKGAETAKETAKTQPKAEKKTVNEPVVSSERASATQEEQESKDQETESEKQETQSVPEAVTASTKTDDAPSADQAEPEPESEKRMESPIAEQNDGNANGDVAEKIPVSEEGKSDTAEQSGSEEPDTASEPIENPEADEANSQADEENTSNLPDEQSDNQEEMILPEGLAPEAEPNYDSEPKEEPQPDPDKEKEQEQEVGEEADSDVETESGQESTDEEPAAEEHIEPETVDTFNEEEVQPVAESDSDDEPNVDADLAAVDDGSAEQEREDGDSSAAQDEEAVVKKPHHFTLKTPNPQPEPEEVPEQTIDTAEDQVAEETPKTDAPHTPAKKKGIGGLFGKFLPKNSVHENAVAESAAGQPKEPATKDDVRDDSEFSDELPGTTLCHTHIIKLKKTFGNAVSDDYVFYIWPIEVIEMYPDRVPSAIFVYAKSPNGTVVQKVSDAKIKYVAITLDEKQFNIFGVWQNGKFKTEVALINKTASVYSKIEIVKADDPDIADDSMLDPFRSAKENRKPEYFIVPLSRTNRGQENAAIAAFARVNDKNYVINTPGKTPNSLLVTSANITSQITGRWVNQQFTFDIQTVEPE